MSRADGYQHDFCSHAQDNGSGMPHEQIPDMLGRVLSGTKYGVCQTRGKFGLGAKMALIWSKMTTGMPFDICSAQAGRAIRSHYILDLDIIRNAPNVHSVEVRRSELTFKMVHDMLLETFLLTL
jgi:DNA topoisomerase VI subunit B